MKNVFKKVTAAAMALTLLGAGTTITKNISPKTSNTLTASAATRYDGHAHGQYTYDSTYTKLVAAKNLYKGRWISLGYYVTQVVPCKRCQACHEIV